jgi:hypothetical protein
MYYRGGLFARIARSHLINDLALPKWPLFQGLWRPQSIYEISSRQFGIDPSHVSRVAYGHRKNKKISKALQAELRKLLATAQKNIRNTTKK